MSTLFKGVYELNDFIEINILARPMYKKCSCCELVMDIHYQVNIKSVKNKKLIQGTLNMCKSCGTNLNAIMGNELEPGEEVIKTFNFSL